MEVYNTKIYYRNETNITPTNFQLVRICKDKITFRYNLNNQIVYINEHMNKEGYLYFFEILNDYKLWRFSCIDSYNVYKYFIINVYIVPEFINQYLNTSLCLSFLLSQNFWGLPIFTNINIENKSFIPLFDEINTKDSFKLNLYDYQKKSLAKMIAIEKNEVENSINYTYNLKLYNNTILYDPIASKKVDEQLFLKIKSRGGILSDEMGLGKTITSIALIDCNPVENLDNFNNDLISSRATLILCQSHLIKQWESEIKRCNPKFKLLTIMTKTSYNNLTFNDFIDKDIILTSYQFIINRKFYIPLYCNSDKLNFNDRKKRLNDYYNTYIRNIEYNEIKKFDRPMFEFFHFHRLLLDEGHELLGENLDTQTSSNYMKNWVSNISANNYWYISGTPFTNLQSSVNCSKFIKLQLYNNNNIIFSYDNMNDTVLSEILAKEYLWNNILEKVCIRHRKVDVENQINIHGFEEKLLWLKFTDIERKLYDAKKDKVSNEYLQQLCCHPLIVESSKKIFGNVEVDLSLMQDKLIDYHKKNHDKYKIKLENLDATKPEYRMLKKTFEYQMNESKYIFTILERMKEPDKIEDTCPICLDEINNITITACGHLFCYDCIKMCLDNKKKCPSCNADLKDKELLVMNLNKPVEEVNSLVRKYGSKLGKLITIINQLIVHDETRIIIFSQWEDMLSLVSKTLAENGIGNCFVKGNVFCRNAAIRKFKNGKNKDDDDNKVIMLSLKNAASGTNLTEATHIFFIEPINDSKDVIKTIESQAIARACRIGQKHKTLLIRILLADTIEEKIYKEKYSNNVIVSFEEQNFMIHN